MPEINTIYIDGRFYKQPLTGVQRYGRELLQTWDELLAMGAIDCERYRFELLIPRLTNVPDFIKIHTRSVGVLQGHAWAQIELPYYSRSGVLFSPSNVLPLASIGSTTVVTVHSLAHLNVGYGYSFFYRRLYRALTPATLAAARAVITVSEAEKHNIIRFYPGVAGRIAVVYHGVRARSEIPATPPREDVPYALWVGTLTPFKNPQLAIEAIGRVRSAITLRLAIIGGAYRGLRSAMPQLPEDATRWVSFTGQVDSAQLAKLYRSALCLLVTSSYESFGLPAVEAMASGCPVVASDLPALREVCGDAALYCRPERADDFDAAIRRLSTDDALRQKLIKRGLWRSRQFTWESCALNTFRVIQAAMPEPRGDSHVFL